MKLPRLKKPYPPILREKLLLAGFGNLLRLRALVYHLLRLRTELHPDHSSSRVGILSWNFIKCWALQCPSKHLLVALEDRKVFNLVYMLHVLQRVRITIFEITSFSLGCDLKAIFQLNLAQQKATRCYGNLASSGGGASPELNQLSMAKNFLGPASLHDKRMRRPRHG